MSDTPPQSDNSADTDNPTIKVKKVPQRKIVYIEIDDEITSVYEQVKNLKMDEVYVVVPKRAVLLDSVVNLKILKNKLSEIGKKFFIITNDSVGTKLAHQAGITVYDRIEQNLDMAGRIPADSPRMKISPLTAVKNFFEEEAPKKMAERKISINEIIKKTRTDRKSFKPLSILSSFKSADKSKKPIPNFRRPVAFFSTNRGALSGLIIISFFVLLLISYIALPGATLYLAPSSNVLQKSVNVTLAEVNKNAAELNTHPRNIISAYTIIPSEPIKVTFSYHSSGTIFKGENARGQITIINKRTSPWQLVTKTRFQNSEGLIFRIAKGVTVPPARGTTDGRVVVEVVADESDVYGKVVGERGNIATTSFFLPGLNEANRKILFAESKTEMSGGKTIVTKVISKEDVEAATNKAKEAAVNGIIPALEKVISEMNVRDKTDLKLLTEENITWKRAISYNEPQVIVPKDLEGKPLEIFDISATISARGLAYKKSDLLNILTTELNLRKSPEKRILKIEPESVSYQLFEIDADRGKYKITANIKGIEEYDLDPTQENGARLIQKIKEHILGKDVKEAQDYIQNLPEIHNVEIKSWPIWAPTIPTVIDNIEVKIVK